jgi:hypothetical protein
MGNVAIDLFIVFGGGSIHAPQDGFLKRRGMT